MRFKIIIVIVFIIAFLVFNASAGCGRWVVRDNTNTDYLEDPVFDEAVSSSTVSSPVQTENATKSDTQNTQNTQNAAKPDAKENKAPALDVSGKWLVSLGEASTPINLILIQSKDRIQGYGSLNDNDAEIPMTATGTLSGDTISLDARPVVEGSLNKINKEYKLNLAKANDIFKGSYEIYVGGDLSEKGNATAARS
jgi:hypothetical protein